MQEIQYSGKWMTDGVEDTISLSYNKEKNMINGVLDFGDLKWDLFGFVFEDNSLACLFSNVGKSLYGGLQLVKRESLYEYEGELFYIGLNREEVVASCILQRSE